MGKLHDAIFVAIGFAAALPVPYLVGRFNGPDSGAGAGAGAAADASGASSSSSPSSSSASAPAAPAAPAWRYKMEGVAPFCNKTVPYPEKYPEWDVIGTKAHTWGEAQCHWASMWHPAVPMRPLDVCTHDPAQDGVISTFLHTYHFWGGPDDYNLLLAMGPCTAERPYMLDIGANLGVYTILGASRGCRAIAFEPLSQNILRLQQSLQRMGAEKRALLFKHAVGKSFTPVKIGFRPFNPGASAIGVEGETTERMEQITIDGLLLGDNPPNFKEDFPDGPPVIGKHINFIKIDTEGYDVAVASGMIKTLVEGRPPHILIEFGPNDAQGTAGCNPYHFVQFMYGAGYRMYEGAKAYNLRTLLDDELPFALSGKGRRVFEAWFIHDDAARNWMELGMLQRYNQDTQQHKE
jgi:FkbM family methyltransferase